MDKLAVYAGTFDPITNGHRDIVERALKIFGRVIVAVVAAPTKNTLFSCEERIDLAKQAFADLGERVTVEAFPGLLVDFVRARNARVIVRGLRAVSDYEYEAQMAVINRQLNEEIETVFLMTSKHSSFVSSSIVRQVAGAGGDVSSMVPAVVSKRLQERFLNRGKG